MMSVTVHWLKHVEAVLKKHCISDLMRLQRSQGSNQDHGEAWHLSVLGSTAAVAGARGKNKKKHLHL